MDDIYDQELETADESQTQEARAAAKSADEPRARSSEAQGNAAPQPNSVADDSVRLNKEEYADFQRMRQSAQMAQLEMDFKKSYPDFNMKKITDKILEIDEKNPGAGDALLSPVGMENVYLKYFHGKALEQTDDEFDVARGTGGGASVKELVGKINKGEASDSEKQALYARLF